MSVLATSSKRSCLRFCPQRKRCLQFHMKSWSASSLDNRLHVLASANILCLNLKLSSMDWQWATHDLKVRGNFKADAPSTQAFNKGVLRRNITSGCEKVQGHISQSIHEHVLWFLGHQDLLLYIEGNWAETPSMALCQCKVLLFKTHTAMLKFRISVKK